ncbi:hypothetical protein [Clostridium sp.]|uniref:hypothetical protein n=1 Tax=Clostridium sp. TaxID=1506 RepID=UPI0039957B76
MEKKFINLRKFLLILLCILAFFTIFKIFKGKSFFDTIVEYQNDIYSENSPIENLDYKNYFAKYEENIPIKYEEISKINSNEYIVKNKESIYKYNTKEEKEEFITTLVDKNKDVFELIAKDNWLIWGESETWEDEEKIYYKWDIFLKNLSEKSSDIKKIDSGNFNRFKSEQRNFNSLIPDSFSIEDNKLLYRKMVRSEHKNNNIISDLVTSELVLYDLSNDKLNTVYGLGDVSIELLSNPKISNNIIAFEKRTLPDENGIFKKAEIYTYNILTKEVKKIIENKNIISFDLNKDNIIVLSGNIDLSVYICNLKDNKKVNILYKGSKAEKYIHDKNEISEIYSIEFIDNNNIIINYRAIEGKLGILIYNLKSKKFYSLEEDINNYIEDNKYDNPLINANVFQDEIRIQIGNYIKKIVEIENEKTITFLPINNEEIDLYKDKLNNNDIYYKYLIYKLK